MGRQQADKWASPGSGAEDQLSLGWSIIPGRVHAHELVKSWGCVEIVFAQPGWRSATVATVWQQQRGGSCWWGEMGRSWCSVGKAASCFCFLGVQGHDSLLFAKGRLLCNVLLRYFSTKNTDRPLGWYQFGRFSIYQKIPTNMDQKYPVGLLL